MFKKVNENSYLVSGKARYAIVNKPRTQKKFQSQEDEHIYKIDLLLEDEEYMQMSKLLVKKKSNAKLKLIDKPDDPDHGGSYFGFRREAVFNEKGEPVDGPGVVDAAGKPLNKDILIGNGSDVVVSFITNGYGQNGQHSVVLNGVQVTNLVPYTPPAKEPPPKPDMSVFNTGNDKDIPF